MFQTNSLILNIRQTMLLPEWFYLNSQAAFGCCEYEWVKLKKMDANGACNISTCPLASEFGKKKQSGKQNKTLNCSARQYKWWFGQSLCNVNHLCLTEWRGKWKCWQASILKGQLALLSKQCFGTYAAPCKDTGSVVVFIGFLNNVF